MSNYIRHGKAARINMLDRQNKSVGWESFLLSLLGAGQFGIERKHLLGRHNELPVSEVQWDRRHEILLGQ